MCQLGTYHLQTQGSADATRLSRLCECVEGIDVFVVFVCEENRCCVCMYVCLWLVLVQHCECCGLPINKILPLCICFCS